MSLAVYEFMNMAGSLIVCLNFYIKQKEGFCMFSALG